MDIVKLALQENAPWTISYGIFAVIICLINGSIQFHRQLSQIPFMTIIFRQAFLVLTALLVFSMTLTGFWFGSSLYQSEKHFANFCTLLQLCALVIIHLYLIRKTGLQLQSKVPYLIFTSLILALPNIGLSLLLSAFEHANMR